MAELFTILGKGALRLGAPKVQNITDVDFVALTCFDTQVKQRGEVTVDAVAGTLTYTGTVAKGAVFNIGINADFPGTEELQISAFVNGVAYSGNPTSLQGGGDGKPVDSFWRSEVILQPNDVIDIRGKNGDVGAFDINFLRSSLVIEMDE